MPMFDFQRARSRRRVARSSNPSTGEPISYGDWVSHFKKSNNLISDASGPGLEVPAPQRVAISGLGR